MLQRNQFNDSSKAGSQQFDPLASLHPTTPYQRSDTLSLDDYTPEEDELKTTKEEPSFHSERSSCSLKDVNEVMFMPSQTSTTSRKPYSTQKTPNPKNTNNKHF